MQGECSLVGEQKCWDGGLIILEATKGACFILMLQLGMALHFGAFGYGVFGGMFVAKRMTEIEFSYMPVVNGIITSAMGVGIAVAGAGVGAILGGAVGGVVGVLHVTGCSIGIASCKLKA